MPPKCSLSRKAVIHCNTLIALWLPIHTRSPLGDMLVSILTNAMTSTLTLDMGESARIVKRSKMLSIVDWRILKPLVPRIWWLNATSTSDLKMSNPSTWRLLRCIEWRYVTSLAPVIYRTSAPTSKPLLVRKPRSKSYKLRILEVELDIQLKWSSILTRILVDSLLKTFIGISCECL